MRYEFPIGIGRNPLVNNIFCQEFYGQGDFPPPISAFRITDANDIRTTDAGDKRITDN